MTSLGGSSRCAMEEGFTSRGGRNLRLPLRFGLRPQGPCRVGTGESGYVFSEEWNYACLSSCSWGFRPLVKLCVESAGFSRRCMGVSVTLRFELFSSFSEQWLLSSWGSRASHYSGFSCCRAHALEHRISSCGART